jgi:hypothetical protein
MTEWQSFNSWNTSHWRWYGNLSNLSNLIQYFQECACDWFHSTVVWHSPVIRFPAQCCDPLLVSWHGPSHLQPSVWIPHNNVAIFTAWSHIFTVGWPSKAEHPVFVACKHNHSISWIPLSLSLSLSKPICSQLLHHQACHKVRNKREEAEGGR